MLSQTPTGENESGARFRLRRGAATVASFMDGGTASGRRGVPLFVPLPFLISGICAAAFFALLAPFILPLALQAPEFPRVLALVHIVTLGWLTMTIMGASLQLVPVIVVAPLRAQALLRWQYPVFLCGVVGLASGFWWWQTWLLIVGGTLVVLAAAHYALILGVTFARATTRPLSVRYLSASLCYLCLVVGLGLTLACNFVGNFLDATLTRLLLLHVTLGVVGWLSCTLIGVSYTLVRLFSLAHTHGDRLGKYIWFILNSGICGLAAGEMLAWSPLIWLGSGLLALAAGLFAIDFWRMLRERQRKKLEATQYHSIAALFYFVLVILAGVTLLLTGRGTPPLFTALGLGALIGWLGQSIVGYLYKIVPFLIWSERYGPLVGKQKVPLMRDLIHERWTWISWWLLNLSLPVMIGAACLQQASVLQVASLGLAAGLCLFVVNLLLALWHLRARP
jgi:hypothetical protein